jgi:hypothetical protein
VSFIHKQEDDVEDDEVLKKNQEFKQVTTQTHTHTHAQNTHTHTHRTLIYPHINIPAHIFIIKENLAPGSIYYTHVSAPVV